MYEERLTAEEPPTWERHRVSLRIDTTHALLYNCVVTYSLRNSVRIVEIYTTVCYSVE